MLESRQGDFFSRAKVLHDDSALADIYQDQGYAYAQLQPRDLGESRGPDGGPRLPGGEGEAQTIERIDITGNTKTRDKVIRRELRIYEGDLFSGSGLRRSKEQVNALGFFETVEITYKPGRDDSHVVANVEVKEKSTGSFQVGFGFQLGGELHLHRPGDPEQLPRLGPDGVALRPAEQPPPAGPAVVTTTRTSSTPHWIFSLDLYRTQIDQFDFTREALGGSVGLGYHIFDDVIGSVGCTRSGWRPAREAPGPGPTPG